MKKWLSVLVGSVVLLAAAAIIVPGMMDWSAYQKPAVSMIEEMTGYRVRVDGNIRVRLLPYPAVAVGQVEVQVPDVEGPPVFRARGVSASLALFPLLRGQIHVHGVTLQDPELSLRRGKDGQMDLPEKMHAMMGGGEVGASSGRITIQSVQIQNGQLRFVDDTQGKTHQIEKLNLDLGLSNLTGPYRVHGDATYNGIPVDIDARIGDMADPAADVPAKIQISFPDHDTTLSFDGMVSRRADGDAQGTLRITGSKIGTLAQSFGGKSVAIPSGKIDLTTLISATPRNLVFDQIKLRYNDVALEGNVKLRLPDHDFPRPAIAARLASKNIIDLRPFLLAIPQGKKGNKNTASDFGVDLDVEWTAQGVQIGPEPIKDITLNLVTEQSEIRGKIRAGFVPGNGHVEIALQPRGKSTTAFQLDAAIKNPIKFMNDGIGFSLPRTMSSEMIKDMSVKSRGTYETPLQVNIDSGTVEFSGSKFSFDGSSYNGNGKRPLATLRLSGARFDADAWMSKPAKNAMPKNLKETLKSSLAALAWPMDVDIKAAFETVLWQQKNIRDVVLAARVDQKALTLSQLKIGDMGGMSIVGQGSVRDITMASGIEGSVNIHAADGPALIKQYIPAWEKSVPKGALNFNTGYKGNLDQAQVEMNIQSSNLNVRAAGPVANPFDAPKMDQMQVAFSAPDAGQAIRLIQPGFRSTAALAAPLDIKADATIKDLQYALKNINGRIAGMTIKGDVHVDMTEARPKFSGGMNLGHVPLDAWMGVPQAASSVQTSGARWSRDAIQIDWMRAFDGDFAVKADRVTYRLWTLNDAGVRLDLAAGRMVISDVRAKIFGGTMMGAGTLATPASRQPIQISAQLSLADVNAASVTNAFAGKNLNRVDGIMAMDLDVKGNGISPADLVASLSGSASSRGKDISVNGIDVSKLIAWLATDLKPTTTIQGLTDSFMGTGATVFQTHQGLYTIKNGNIALDQMVFDGDKARLDTTGNVDIPTWRMDTKTTLSVKNPANVPPLTFTLRGPIDRPAQNMVGSLFENYLQQQLGKQVNRLIEKKLGNKLNDLGLGGILEGALPGSTPAPVKDSVPQEIETPAATTPPAPRNLDDIKPEDVLRGVLEGLGR